MTDIVIKTTTVLPLTYLTFHLFMIVLIKNQYYFIHWAPLDFLPLLNPLTLIPALGDLWNYFVIASNLKASQGLFLHYRITLAPLMAWSTILTIYKYKFLKKWYIYIFLLVCPLVLQYQLHLPLSYLTKPWFWSEPQSIKNINEVITYIPENASVVSQNNITPHISHRNNIFTLWPEKKSFSTNSPCSEKNCDWFHWAGNPQYLIIETSQEWDIRHFLADRINYINGIKNLEKTGVIEISKKVGNAVLYNIKKNPNTVTVFP